MKTLFRKTIKKATRVLSLVPLAFLLCNPLFGASETKAVQWEYIVAKFFDGQLTGVSFLSENQKTGGYPQNAPSKFSSIYPKIKSLARVEREGWELRVLQKVFDELGRDGWELVCPIEAGVFGKEMAFIFKRHLQEVRYNISVPSVGIIYDLDNPLEKKLSEFNKKRKEQFGIISRALEAFKPSVGTLTLDKSDLIWDKEFLEDEESRLHFEKQNPDSVGCFTIIISLNFDSVLNLDTYRRSEIKKLLHLSLGDVSRFVKGNPKNEFLIKFSTKSSFLESKIISEINDLYFDASDDGKLEPIEFSENASEFVRFIFDKQN